MQAGMTVTQELIARFLEDMKEKGMAANSYAVYRNRLSLLYEMLPADKVLSQGTLEDWKRALAHRGYAKRTVANAISVANRFIGWMGRRDLQADPVSVADRGADVQPELTRSEYVRLLSAAKNLGKERTYLLIKVFATTGIALQELTGLTVKAIEENRIITAGWGCPRVVHLPSCVREELLSYAAKAGIRHGPIFVTRNGKPLARTSISSMIGRLCRDAQVPQEKGNPRCLRQLYKATIEDIEGNMSILVEQAHERLIEKEQLSVGWDAGKLVRETGRTKRIEVG